VTNFVETLASIFITLNYITFILGIQTLLNEQPRVRWLMRMNIANIAS